MSVFINEKHHIKQQLFFENFSRNFFINTQKELLFNGTRKVESAMVMVDKAK